ncbi:MAG TPA: PDR/VanB family oxidoreductase [Pseudolabrys sp.]|nr:PDR/VanB family oxidoreductase [Pseudolabrys sp.]
MSVAPNTPPLQLKVARKEEVARGIHVFELRDPAGDPLPAFTAGAHVALRTPNGLERKYSLCNDPAERERYVLAVQREAEGRGGSIALVDATQVGDLLTVSAPINDFPLPERATDFIFIAGGIGITPILAMIRRLQALPDKRFKLYYCSRSPEMTAFLNELSVPELNGKVVIHHDGGDPTRAFDFWPILEERKNRAHVLCCGPRGLMQAVRDTSGHWPSTAVHFEAFSEPERTKPDDTAIIVRLAKSGEEIEVPVGTTILEALRAHGLDVPSSCETGTCGTCRTKLLDGEADHRDLVLAEHERGNNIMICVSRARSPKLTIDR